MGIEGGHAIEDSPRLLRDYYRLGVRYMTLTHWNTNNWADSSGDIDDRRVQHHNGLTPFGKDIVQEMNRLGMMVDISHVADKTFYDALETSRGPHHRFTLGLPRRNERSAQYDGRHDRALWRRKAASFRSTSTAASFHRNQRTLWNACICAKEADNCKNSMRTTRQS